MAKRKLFTPAQLQRIGHMLERLGATEESVDRYLDSGIGHYVFHPEARYDRLDRDQLRYEFRLPGMLDLDHNLTIQDMVNRINFGEIDPLFLKIPESVLASSRKGKRFYQFEAGDTFTQAVSTEDAIERIHNLDDKWKMFRLEHLLEFALYFPEKFVYQTVVATGQFFEIEGNKYVVYVSTFKGRSQLRLAEVSTKEWGRNTTLFPRYLTILK